jgi:hypothetical protein
MSLKVCKAELQRDLDAKATLMNAAPYKIGLFKNDYTPADTDTIAAVTAADFGGYSGLQNLTGWGASTWSSPDAVIAHAAKTWTADGTSSNTIYGYYVVDGAGNLAWAERRTDGGVSVGAAGQTYSVTPQFTRRSRF